MNMENEIRASGADKAPRITPADIEANIKGEYYFSAADGIAGKAYGGFNHMSHHPVDGTDPIASHPYHPLSLLTFCVLVLKNGFTVTGESYCARPENFNAEIGRKIARENAVAKVWPLMEYELRSKLSGEGSCEDFQ